MTDGNPIPKSGTLSLLSLGYRGLEAWRAARGTDWIETRRLEALALSEAAATDAPPSGSPGGAAGEVIVVTGVPRSGTSMLMQMLQAGGVRPFTDEARGPDENNPRGYFEHARVKSMLEDASWLRDADGCAVKVVAPLATHLPEGPAYRVVLIERDLDEVIQSQARMLERSDRPSADATTLRQVYRQQIAKTHAWMREAPRTRALRIQHRTIVTDPAGAAERLAAFLEGAAALGGAPFDASAAAAAVDPALYREHRL